MTNPVIFYKGISWIPQVASYISHSFLWGSWKYYQPCTFKRCWSSVLWFTFLSGSQTLGPVLWWVVYSPHHGSRSLWSGGVTHLDAWYYIFVCELLPYPPLHCFVWIPCVWLWAWYIWSETLRPDLFDQLHDGDYLTHCMGKSRVLQIRAQ